MTVQSIILRHATTADEQPLRDLAAVDSQALPAGPFLVAEVDGRAHAALSLSDGSAIADPFDPRRNVIAAGLMAGVSGLIRGRGTAYATASQPRTKVTFTVPPGATDCAVHVYNDPKRHPFWEGRTYTPEPATVPELTQMMRGVVENGAVTYLNTQYLFDDPHLTVSAVSGARRNGRTYVAAATGASSHEVPGGCAMPTQTNSTTK